MKSLMTFLFSFSLLLGAPNPSKQDLSFLKKDYKKLTKEGQLLKKEIINLEKRLGQENKKYTGIVRKMRSLQEDLIKLKNNLNSKLVLLEKEEQRVIKIIDNFILRSMGHEYSSSDMAADNLSIEALLLQRKSIVKLKKDYNALNSEQEQLYSHLVEYQNIEATIRELMWSLENEKREKGHKYLSLKKGKETLGQKLARLKARNKISQKGKKKKGDISFKMTSPLKNFIKMDSKKKGITFSLQGQAPVFASAKGTISYIGRLSNYGKLVMIDHGGDIRSVYLGQYDVKLKKGHALKKGDIIGYTSQTGSLYFEVRRKNQALKTIDWLDENSIKI